MVVVVVCIFVDFVLKRIGDLVNLKGWLAVGSCGRRGGEKGVFGEKDVELGLCR